MAKGGRTCHKIGRNGVGSTGRRPSAHLLGAILWFVFSLVAPWFARQLDSFSFLGFQFGYYMVVQGSLIAFVLLIVVQNLLQDRIDDAYGTGELD